MTTRPIDVAAPDHEQPSSGVAPDQPLQSAVRAPLIAGADGEQFVPVWATDPGGGSGPGGELRGDRRVQAGRGGPPTEVGDIKGERGEGGRDGAVGGDA